jgi:predicted metal-dependent hydrolase
VTRSIVQVPFEEILSRVTVRISQKIRAVHLSLSLMDGLELVVPRGFDQLRVKNILQEKQGWISAAIGRLEDERDLKDPCLKRTPPPKLWLRAIDEIWDVTYQDCAGSVVRVHEHEPHGLVVCRPQGRDELSTRALQSWMHKKARRRLVPWLDDVSREIGMTFSRAVVRVQKTRWASYSRSGTVSVNSNLMFIPPELVRYVFIHELCHSQELNHSSRFWKTVERIEPRRADLDAQLKSAVWKYVPMWTF